MSQCCEDSFLFAGVFFRTYVCFTQQKGEIPCETSPQCLPNFEDLDWYPVHNSALEMG